MKTSECKHPTYFTIDVNFNEASPFMIYVSLFLSSIFIQIKACKKFATAESN